MNLTQDQIDKVLNDYVKKQEREKEYYHTVNKNNEEFKKKNRQRAKDHYDKNKETHKEKYQANKDVLKAKSLYNYYNKRDNIETFITKHPSNYLLLQEKGFVN